jgi:hypothetical protein
MYNECAPVRITGSTTSSFTSYDALPDMFIANIAPAGSCKVNEGIDVVFPDPGEAVEVLGSGPFGPPSGCSGPYVSFQISSHISTPTLIPSISASPKGGSNLVAVTSPKTWFSQASMETSSANATVLSTFYLTATVRYMERYFIRMLSVLGLEGNGSHHSN